MEIVQNSFKRAFQPAFNGDGFSYLTFKGCMNSNSINNDDPKIKMYNLEFSVMGEIKGTTETYFIPVESVYLTSLNNHLSKALKAMGFEEPTRKPVTTQKLFEQFEDDELGNQIFEFLESKRDTGYLAKMYDKQDDKVQGNWSIQVKTLRPETVFEELGISKG